MTFYDHQQYDSIMKTIAITIEENDLQKIAHLQRAEEKSRSEIVREALHLYLDERERRMEEQREAGIFRKHKRRLAQQASELVREQAG